MVGPMLLTIHQKTRTRQNNEIPSEIYDENGAIYKLTCTKYLEKRI